MDQLDEWKNDGEPLAQMTCEDLKEEIEDQLDISHRIGEPGRTGLHKAGMKAIVKALRRKNL